MGAPHARPAPTPRAPDPYRADPDGLRAWLLAMVHSGNLVALVAAVVAFVTRLWALQDALRTRIELAQRRKTPSERLRAVQAELPGLFAPPANDVPPAPPARKKRAKRGPKNRHEHGRPALPADLPRDVRPLYVPAGERRCPCCADEMRVVDHEVTERLDRIPARWVVECTVREVVRCDRCQRGKVLAPAPDAVVDRGILGERLLIDATVEHFRDAVPFERLARDARAQGAPLAANTLARGVGKVIDLLDPIVAHIFRRCMASAVLALDATRLPVLDPTLPNGIRSGALWHLLGDRHWAYFGYAPTGHDTHLEQLAATSLSDVLLSDGSATHNVLERPGRVRAGCHAHARSKLVAAVRAGDPRAAQGLVLYAPLFLIEAAAKRAGDTPAARRARRQRDSRPHLDALHAWVEALRPRVEPKSKLGMALGYLTRQWPRLQRFLDDGRIEVTNNEVERDLRTWVLDRKTWMFVGHAQSAQRTAAALTVLATCSKFGLDPRRYLRDVITALLAGETDLAKLLPENYVPSG